MSRRSGSVERRVWPTGEITWRARWFDASGHRQSASFDRRGDAEAFLAARLTELAKGGDASMAGRRITLAQWWATWQAGRQVGLTTARREVSAWECWIEPHLGKTRLADLRRSVLEAWVAGQVRSGLAPSSITRHVYVLSTCLSAAVRDGLIEQNPAKGLRVPRAPKAEQRYLSVEECRRLVEAAPSHHRTLIQVGLAAGLRLGELIALQVGDFDPLRRSITVKRTALADTKHLGPVKSRAGEGRVIPLPPGLAAELAAQVAGRLPTAWMWPAPKGGRFTPGNFRRRVWDPAVKRAGIVPAPTPHAMRHTAVALWLRGGASLYEASRWAGHASTSTTERIYGHLIEPNGKVSEVVESLLWPGEVRQLRRR